MTKRVAIIGAGVAGLTSIKNALDAGLEPTAFEKDSWLGGIWHFTEDEQRFVAPKSTIFNTSKHFSCFSDFPMPKEYPNYLTVDDFQNYLESYAKKFDLTRRIRFKCEVLKVEKSKDYQDTGKWEIHYLEADRKGSNVCVEVYDFVVICSGVCRKPFLPKIAGIDDFTGRKMHSNTYKSFKPFENRRVLIVGLGNTAGDIACELSRHAKQVYVSTRRGTFVIPRMAAGGIPMDVRYLTRSIATIPNVIINWAARWSWSSLYNLKNLGLEPTDASSISFVLVSDELPHRIVTGSLLVKDEIVGFKGKKVFFKDNTELEDIDDVIFATGYDVDIPILSKSVFNPENAGHQFYKAVFPPELPKSTLAAVGMFRVRGSVIPLTEMQARWIMQVFKGESALPSKEVMMKEVHDRRAAQLDKKDSASATVYVLPEGVIGYLDDIGSLIGVKPNLWKLLFQDPMLAIKCLFGPAIPAQYRLMGPGAWAGAKNVIETVEESRLKPLSTRKVTNTSQNDSSGLLKWIVVSSVIVLIIVLIFYR